MHYSHYGAWKLGVILCWEGVVCAWGMGEDVVGVVGMGKNGELAAHDYIVTVAFVPHYHGNRQHFATYVMQCGNGLVGGYHRFQTATAC